MYYPLSQITPNLYTNGNEYSMVSNLAESYSGYFYKTSTGKYYTGKTPQDLPNVELIPISSYSIKTTPIPLNIPPINIDQENIRNTSYISITNTNVIKVVYSPYYNPELPTDQDYQNGEFRRLFCKKSNELQYIEINEETYTKLLAKDPQILWQLYIPFNISWQLTGDKQQVAKTNKNIVELTSKRLQLFRFNEYLKLDYIKYYK
jgi:hypothetical protein